jgi:hypothetical protein
VATQIIAVRTEQPWGATHEHITHVLTAGRRTLTKREVIDAINGGWESFYTSAGGVVANVTVADCPHCGHGDYITTEPDWTTANNLLSLPRF